MHVFIKGSDIKNVNITSNCYELSEKRFFSNSSVTLIRPLQRDRVVVRSATHDTIRRASRHSILNSKQWPRNLSGENAKDTLKSGSEDMKDKVYKLAETDFKHLYTKTKSTVKEVS